jgi:hypothetical protein
MTDKTIPKAFFHAHPVQFELPIQAFNWHTLVQKSKEFFGVNFMPFILLLCGGIGAFHFKKMLKTICKFDIFIYLP